MSLLFVYLNLHSHHHGSAKKDEQPLVFVGKDITFDSGGISLKPGAVSFFFLSSLSHHSARFDLQDMKLMRGYMG
jgi:hypothetical protein